MYLSFRITCCAMYLKLSVSPVMLEKALMYLEKPGSVKSDSKSSSSSTISGYIYCGIKHWIQYWTFSLLFFAVYVIHEAPLPIYYIHKLLCRSFSWISPVRPPWLALSCGDANADFAPNYIIYYLQKSCNFPRDNIHVYFVVYWWMIWLCCWSNGQ